MKFFNTAFIRISEAEIEDDASFSRHLKVLQAEFRKPKPNVMVVNELMNITFEHRLNDIKENQLPLHHIIEKYPFLQREDQVCSYK